MHSIIQNGLILQIILMWKYIEFFKTNVLLMKKNIAQFPLVILFLIILGLGSCKKLDAPVFKSIEDVELINRNATNVTIAATTHFYNPNNVQITLKHADIDLLLNDKKITNYQKDYNLKIPKNSDFTVPLEITLSLSDLNSNIISSAISILTGKKQTLTYLGHVKIKAYGIRVKIPVEGSTKIDLNEL